MLKHALLNSADAKAAAKKHAQENEDKENEDLVDLNEEKKGKYPKVDVTEEDLPSHLFEKKDEDSKADGKHSKADAKHSKTHKGFPFKKKK